MIDLCGDLTGNGISKLVFTILSAVAEAERDRTRERVQDIVANKRKRGMFVGGRRPTGYAVTEDGALVPDKAEQAANRAHGEAAQGRPVLAPRPGQGERSNRRDRVARDGPAAGYRGAEQAPPGAAVGAWTAAGNDRGRQLRRPL
jgi:DNA invertase Pin-like site-specific DNA recombinase